MLFDMRIYACRPGGLQPQLRMYEQYGMKPQTRILGQPVLFATTETGEITSYVHIWGYESAADREAKRAVLFADAEWNEYRRRLAEGGNVARMNTSLLNDVPFLPYRR